MIKHTSELGWAMLFQHSQDLMAIMSADGRFHTANPAFCRLLGQVTTCLTGRALADLCDPTDRQVVIAALERLSVEAPSVTFEARLCDTDGRRPRIAWTAVYAMSDGAVYLTGHDISRPLQKHQALRLAHDERQADLTTAVMFLSHIIEEFDEVKAALTSMERNFSLMFEANPRPMWLYDIESGEIMAANPAAVTASGLSTERLSDLSVEDIPSLPGMVTTATGDLSPEQLAAAQESVLEINGRKAALLVA